MSADGFRKPKAPTKKELQQQLQQTKAQLSIAIEQMHTMGPYMEQMMIACWTVMRLAHKGIRSMELALSLDAKQTEEQRNRLLAIREAVTQFAIEWKHTNDPAFPIPETQHERDRLLDEARDVEIEFEKDQKDVDSQDDSGRVPIDE